MKFYVMETEYQQNTGYYNSYCEAWDDMIKFFDADECYILMEEYDSEEDYFDNI